MMERAALAIILYATSQTPIGHTPGQSSRAISLQERKDERISGDKYLVHTVNGKQKEPWPHTSQRRQSRMKCTASTLEDLGAPKV